MSDPVRNPHGAGVLDESSFGAGAVVAAFTITVHASGALSIQGPIEHREWCLSVLANAADAVRNHHSRKAGGLILPSKDVSIAAL